MCSEGAQEGQGQGDVGGMWHVAAKVNEWGLDLVRRSYVPYVPKQQQRRQRARLDWVG